jgi:hypothetical protein
MSGGSIWASLECHCCFWIAAGSVSYLTMWLLPLQLFKNITDTQEKLRLNLHSLSVSELLEYGRMTSYCVSIQLNRQRHYLFVKAWFTLIGDVLRSIVCEQRRRKCTKHFMHQWPPTMGIADVYDQCEPGFSITYDQAFSQGPKRGRPILVRNIYSKGGDGSRFQKWPFEIILWAWQHIFVGVVTCFWVWPQFSVVEELWCFIRWTTVNSPRGWTFLLLVLDAHFRH